MTENPTETRSAPAPSGAAPLVRIDGLEKTFTIGFLRKKVEAVRGVSFEVRPR